ncbi:hypothetical protein [Kamptonema formosum]|uniref:hypothetical protein n=1 Tax=Kamptonema formosum TaxID=331992 RepID=UPI0012DF2344|nr:hypothetical protein [Oscillatoria sp. PCC 10802]
MTRLELQRQGPNFSQIGLGWQQLAAIYLTSVSHNSLKYSSTLLFMLSETLSQPASFQCGWGTQAVRDSIEGCRTCHTAGAGG